MSESKNGQHNGKNGNGSKSSDNSEDISDSEKLRDFLKKKMDENSNRRVAVFSHSIPDPDAIGAQMGMKFLLNIAYGLEVDCFYDGEISHPQNKAVVQLLDPNLEKACQYKPEKYALNILVDTIPANAGTNSHEVAFDIVLDHHKDLPGNGFSGLCIHHHSGSACGIVYDLIKNHELAFDIDNEEHTKIATAILVGVLTDTDNGLSQDTTKRDIDARQDLFKFRDDDSMRKIIRFNRPMSWIKLQGVAINDAEIEDGVAVAGLGILNSEQKDVIADIASFMLTWGSVQTAVVFALFDGNRLQGSVRTNDDTIEIHSLCEKLGGEQGKGGGKSCAGGYTKFFGSFGFESDEDDKLKQELWEITKKREIAKIFKLLKK